MRRRWTDLLVAAMALSCTATPTTGVDARPFDGGDPVDVTEAGAPDRTDAIRFAQPVSRAWEGSGPACSADGWCWEAPSPAGGEVLALSASERDDGFALTRDGVLMHARQGALSASRTYPYDRAVTEATVWSASSTDVWVAFRGGMLRGDGRTWQRVVFYDDFNEPTRVWGSAPNDVWVAGTSGDAIHFDGARWEPRGVPTGEDIVSLSGRGAEAWVQDASGRVWRWREGAWQGGETRTAREHRGLWIVAPDDAWTCDDGAAFHWNGREWQREVVDRMATSQRCVVWSDGTDVWFSDGVTVRVRNSDGRWDYESETLLVTAVGGTPENIWVGRSDGVIQRRFMGQWVGVTRTRPRFDVTRIVGSDADTLRAVTTTTVMGFDGVEWFEASAPTRFYELHGVWPEGARDTWLAGLVRGGMSDSGRVSRWNRSDGERDVLESPTPMRAVSAGATDMVWAVGDRGAAWRWDGRAWASVETGVATKLMDVWAPSRDVAWAVGEGSTALRWDGARWVREALPVTVDLVRVHGRDAGDVWAVGQGGGRSYVLRWNGTSWARDTAGLPEGYAARGVWAGDGAVWLAGTTALRRDERVWNSESTGAEATLRAVWGTRDGVVRVGGSAASIFVRRVQ